MRKTCEQPASIARRSSARVFELFDEPMITNASTVLAMEISAVCLLVVAKHKSLFPGVHTSGNFFRT